MAHVIIFGLRDCASLAHFYLQHDSPHQVVAFTVTREYLPAELEHEGKPVVPFDELERHYPPAKYHFFAPMSSHGMNRAREGIYRQGKERGYSFISYVSSRATVFAGTPIGENCFILEDTTIQPFAQIGNNVVLWSGSHVAHHCIISDHVFFAPHAVLGGNCMIEPYCFLGLNSSVRNGLRVAEGTLVAMGANVCRNTEPWAVYQGNPARKQRMASTEPKVP